MRVFDVAVSTGDGEVRVEAVGEIDMRTAGELRTALGEAVHLAGTGPIVVDLGRVNFLDSTGVQVLLDGYHSALVAGGTLTLQGAHGTVARVLQIVGLAKMFGLPPGGGPGESVPHQYERPG